MNDVKWERYGALGGIVFVVLSVIGAFLPGSPPKTSDSAKDIVAFFRDGASSLKVGAFLTAIAGVFLLWWLGTLWRTLRRAENNEPRLAIVAVGGTIYASALYMTSQAIYSSIAIRIGELAREAQGFVRFFYLMSTVLGCAALFGIVALVGGTSAVALRSGVFPRWFAFAGAVLAVAIVIAGYGIATDADWTFTVGLAVVPIWGLWMIVISVLMFRKRPAV